MNHLYILDVQGQTFSCHLFRFAKVGLRLNVFRSKEIVKSMAWNVDERLGFRGFVGVGFLSSILSNMFVGLICRGSKIDKWYISKYVP